MNIENKEKDIKELSEEDAKQANGGFTGTILGDKLIGKIIDEVKDFQKTLNNVTNIPSPLDQQ